MCVCECYCVCIFVYVCIICWKAHTIICRINTAKTKNTMWDNLHLIVCVIVQVMWWLLRERTLLVAEWWFTEIKQHPEVIAYSCCVRIAKLIISRVHNKIPNGLPFNRKLDNPHAYFCWNWLFLLMICHFCLWFVVSACDLSFLLSSGHFSL